MQLFDSHCHLQDAVFDGEVPFVVERAGRAGVERMVCCGLHPGDWATVADLASCHPVLIPAFGLHPWFVEERTDGWVDDLARRLEEWPGAPLGEVGLDFGKNRPPRPVQRSVFETQVELAARVNRPMSVHCTKAWGRLLEVLDGASVTAVLHGYGGSAELVGPLLKSGAYFSFSGAITRKGRPKLRSAVQAVPLDRLLVETDAPYCPARGGGQKVPSEPAILPVVVAAVAEARGESYETVATATRENGRRVFGVCE